MRFERSDSLHRISLLLGLSDISPPCIADSGTAKSYYSAHALTLWHSAHALTSAAFVWTLTMGFSTCTPHQTGRGGGEHAAPRGNRARTCRQATTRIGSGLKWVSWEFDTCACACVHVCACECVYVVE